MKYRDVLGFIKRNSRFILTTHETPDGDAIGSEYAMFRTLKKLGKEVRIINADRTPENFKFVDVDDEIEVLEDPAALPDDLADYVLMILDVNDTNNIGNIVRYVVPKVREYFIIDHHDSDADITSPNYIQQNASSTGEIVYRIIGNLEVDMDLETANSLYMAIAYDTGSFIYPKTSALTLQIGYKLVARGVNPNAIYRRVYESKSVASLVLQSMVLATLELKLENRVAIQTMSKETLVASEATYEEAHQLINIPLAAKPVRVSLFFKENLSALLRCSLRSKGEIDVAQLAQEFGGGGHKTAAGFKCGEPLEVVKAKMLQRLKSLFDNNVT
jgi:phosphoesterase RecJ-like protein